MINGLVKILAGTAFIALSAFGGYNGGKYICYKNYQEAQEKIHERVVSREDYNREIGGGEVVWELFFGIMAGSIAGGIVGGIISKRDLNTNPESERDPALDDPGAFGPGGLRY